MKFPENLRFTKEHMWAEQLADGTWQAGITDYAQDLLGDVVFVEPPKVGAAITEGTACGLVESVKTGSDLHAPLTGEVIAINDDVINSPEMMNDAPYKSWIFKFKAADDNQNVLLAADDYINLIDD